MVLINNDDISKLITHRNYTFLLNGNYNFIKRILYFHKSLKNII